ncbi:anthranilate synthase component I family protein [Anaerotardibacter muris]|uniref:anthranilate synthase component I family protein n=1 Tax=Anaerotardibacter muris TaxID=2941505 RepID=UPI00203C1033|nr:anthranilate synthase component I family protein [Anaerotardibacter muris]
MNAGSGETATAPTTTAPATTAAAAPTLEEVRNVFATTDFARVPVKRELYADILTPIEAMRRVRAASNHCFLLESAEADKSWGRYTFIGFNPSMEVTCADGALKIRRNVEDGTEEIEERLVDNPSNELRSILAGRTSAQLEGFPPFTGGLVGYFSYDFIKYAEPTLREALEQGEGDFLDLDLMLFDSLICFDAVKQKIILMTGVYREPDKTVDKKGAAPDLSTLEERYAAAQARLDQMERILISNVTYPFAPLHLERPLTPRFSLAQYCEMVKQAKHHIVEGDIFQVVLSNPQTAPATGSLFDAYRNLRCANPSPYMFYFTSDDVEIAGASPETLVRLRDGVLNTYPLAGTRPRGATPAEDAALEAEVLADEKERAEHNMLVDLGRNDLGRISRIGSVSVDSYMQVLKFSRVMHIGSTVTGQIAEGRDAIDAVSAVLPAGTLSGAPKLRACEIIQDLEGARRGIYGGAIGYLDFSGNMDMCIAIRLAYKKNDVICVQSGAGIVADSIPEREFTECVNKARAVTEALEAAEGGLR